MLFRWDLVKPNCEETKGKSILFFPFSYFPPNHLASVLNYSFCSFRWASAIEKRQLFISLQVRKTASHTTWWTSHTAKLLSFLETESWWLDISYAIGARFFISKRNFRNPTECKWKFTHIKVTSSLHKLASETQQITQLKEEKKGN